MPEQGGAARVARLRWVMWGMLCVAFVISIFHRVSLAVVADQIMRDFAMSAVAFGGLVSTYFYVYFFMQIPSGILADRLGPRKTATIGLLVAGGASFLFAAAPGSAVAFTARSFIALGVSVIFVSILQIQATWFRSREYGVVSGLVTVIAVLGVMLSARPLAWAAEGMGWRAALQWTGVLTLVIGALCWLVVRDRPADLGLPAPEPASTGAPNRGPGIRTALGMVFRNRYTWPVFFTFFGIYGPYQAYAAMWSVPFLMQGFGLDRAGAADLVMVSSLGTLIGGPAFGWASDRLMGKRKPAFVVGMLLFLGSWSAMIFGASQPWGRSLLGPIQFLQGFSWSCFVIAFPMAREVNSPLVSGIASGTVNAAGFLSTALLQPVLGWVLDRAWTGAMSAGAPVYPVGAYQTAGGISIAVAAVGFIALLLSPETHCRTLPVAAGSGPGQQAYGA